MKAHFTELAIITAVECLNEVYYDKIICNILISNLNLAEQHNIAISNALREKLSNFLLNYLKNFHHFINLEDEDYLQNLNLIALLFEFQDDISKNKIIETVLPVLICSSHKLIELKETSKLIKYLRIIEVLVKYIPKIENASKIQLALESLKKLLSEAFQICDQSVTIYSFSLLTSYYQTTNSTGLAREIWFTAVQNFIKNQSSSEYYLIIVSYLINSSLLKTEVSEIIGSHEFWNALQLCLEDEHCVQKYALHILKYAVFNVNDNPTRFRSESSVDNAFLNEYYEWWKTYFVIMENLNEKQTHLVLPVFTLTDSLIDSRALTDVFWLLRLLESGLKHDSRIVRVQALLCLLNVNVSKFNKRHIPYLVKIVLNTMNDSAFFWKTCKLKKFDILNQKFILWITDFSRHECFQFFFENLYSVLTELKWSPVPLFYTLKSLTLLKSECLDLTLIGKSKTMITTMTKYHNIKIRAAIQCLFIEFITSNCKEDSETLLGLLELLNGFNEDECLLRGVETWLMLVNFIRNTIDFRFAEEYVVNTVGKLLKHDLTDSQAIIFARNIILFHDSFSILESSKEVEIYFSNLLNTFVNASHKPYLNKRIQNNYLKFLTNLLKIERSWSGTNQNFKNDFSPLIQHNTKYLLTYVLENITNSDDFDLIIFYEKSLHEIPFSYENSVLLGDWAIKAANKLKHERQSTKFESLKVILWIYKTIDLYPKMLNIGKIKSNISSAVNLYLANQPTEVQISGKIYSNFMKTFWSVMKFFYYDNSVLNQESLILESLDLVHKENLAILLDAVGVLLSKNKTQKELVIKIMDFSWKLVQETQTTSYYTKSIKSWIQAFFQKSLLQDSTFQPQLVFYIDEMMKRITDDGDGAYYSVILVLQEMQRFSDLFNTFRHISITLVNIFSVTHMNRKDQRIEHQTIDYIHELRCDMSINQINKFKTDCSPGEMRLMALNLLLKLCYENDSIKHCTHVVKYIICMENTKKRYFNDSAHHRIKHKNLQLLLIFEAMIHHLNSSEIMRDLFKDIFQYAVHNLLTEPHQPSIRYMLEWLLVRVVIHFPDLKNKFWDLFSEASEERVGSICSFISVAYHIANVCQEESFINSAIESILPWTMAQHFNARLYAQTVLGKLIQMNVNSMQKYDFIKNSLEHSLKTGNAVKNAIKLQQDFYFAYFHAIDHFSLRTILWDLPRLSNISSEEWIRSDLFNNFITSEYDFIPFIANDDEFCNYTSSMWIIKATELSNDKHFDTNIQETQRKFIPQNDLPISTKSLENYDNLIVVASLVDRAPNLGGLTRTCEIFAVSTLVINNLEITKNKEFTSLSITAEKHIRIKEVKNYDLFNYLKILRENGYFLIGVEQTTSSKSLNEFKFPRKSALILGNEKEGIPADLLPLLNVCVEIPQAGVIRSLNVHVSASLFIWEYAKQHLFNH